MTRHLPTDETSAPAGREHRVAAEDLNRPRGLLGPCARERACTVLRGPRCSNAPGLPGAAQAGGRRRGREQPRQSRAGPALLDGPGAVSETGRYTQGTGFVTPLHVLPALTQRMRAG